MKAPIEWLKEFTKIDIEAKALSDALTISGSKVEEIIVSGEEISHVYTGKMISVVPLEDSDHLVICQLDMGKSELGTKVQIVTGAPNARVGMICPVALSGATLPDGKKIKAGKLRGVDSNGMCCSLQELGYSATDFPGGSEEGLWDMPSNTPIGMDIKEYLGLGHIVIDFEITSNRPDCFSIEGLARETAVTLGHTFSPRVSSVKEESSTVASSVAKIEILAPDKCFRYCSRIVEDVVVGPSPAWMQERLRDAGMRPINNIVDITNYVCLELGQPMHAFDLTYLKNAHVMVRNAKENEKIITLDGAEHTLDSSILVIADEEKACAIAGVMGGENSEVMPTTRTILFESASFDAGSVRRAAVKNGLRTEASLRYEKSLDPENAIRGLERACELVNLLGCGKVCKGIIDVYPVKKEKVEIPFSPPAVNAFLGTNIDEEKMLSILEQIGCEWKKDAQNEYICVCPSWRPDLLCSADLAEEIARFYGYNNITPSLLEGKETTLGGRSETQLTLEKIKNILISQGFYEAITYSFESPKEMDKLFLLESDSLRQQVVIQNPLGEDFSVMRSSMVPSLLRVAATNGNRSVKEASVFEAAYVYLPKGNDTLPEERPVLCAFSYDLEENYKSGETFFRVKGAVEELLDNLGIKGAQISPSADISYLHPGRTASIIVRGKCCGSIGYVHPKTAAAFDAPLSTVLLELDLSSLYEASTVKRKYTSLPKYPGVTRDLAVVLPSNVPVGEIEKIIRKKGGKLLESFQLFDVYTGKQVEEGKKSVAYNLFFRSEKGTLTDEEIFPVYESIREALKDQLDAHRR